MTNRLYYNQTYMTEFDAVVTAVREKEGKSEAALNQSAFYPTSGGQPYDTGTLQDKNVLNVYVDEFGEVWHVLDGGLTVGDTVHGKIDWARRFDHMQQHAGEHMLAGAVYRLFGGNTIGLHLGADISTIDVSMPQGEVHLTSEQIAALEQDVNEQIQADVPIRCWFPDPDELSVLPLRKAPTVTEHIRVVAIGDKEMVACGGTHPSSAGQIGMVRIVNARPARGKLRLGFVCGMRAYRDYQLRAKVSDEVADMLSTKIEWLPQRISEMRESMVALQRELASFKRDQALFHAKELLKNVQKIGDVKLVAGVLPELAPDALRELASGLIEKDRIVALLATSREDGGYSTLFARSTDVSWDMGKLLREASAACGGKGGGKADFAQGSAPTDEVLKIAARMLMLGV